MTQSRISGTVRIVGAGLLGTSIGLALSKHGVDVVVDDNSPANQRLAIEYGAGRKPATSDSPALVVVCVPPDVTARTVAAELGAHPQAVVTDVASVKLEIARELSESGADLSRYVGSHPMAGRERGGALAGRADLFFTRPWVIAPTATSSSDAVRLVESLALELGAAPMRMDAATHDRAVAVVSHVPQVVSSLLAARLNDVAADDVALAGQGLRDTTRIAASDPNLWIQILSANADQVRPILEALNQDLAKVVAALDDVEAAGSLTVLGDALKRGNSGVSLIPGKHGAQAQNYARVVVMIDDKPGQMARLLTEIGEIGVNLEDLKLEHSPGAQIGLTELFVLPEVEGKLIESLSARGWRIAG